MKKEYRVVTSDAQKHTTELGEYESLEEAMDCANNWALARRTELKEKNEAEALRREKEDLR